MASQKLYTSTRGVGLPVMAATSLEMALTPANLKFALLARSFMESTTSSNDSPGFASTL